LLIVPAALAAALRLGFQPGPTLIVGLAVFALVFAVNSAVHSYLVLAYTDEDSVALDVGFYYMANAGGRLLGTLLSGVVFQLAGFQGCLLGSAALVLAAGILSLSLPRGRAVSLVGAHVESGE
jgi:predicted MFS family arabinose efflux permease